MSKSVHDLKLPNLRSEFSIKAGHGKDCTIASMIPLGALRETTGRRWITPGILHIDSPFQMRLKACNCQFRQNSLYLELKL